MYVKMCKRQGSHPLFKYLFRRLRLNASVRERQLKDAVFVKLTGF
jgi:hypothetical protein